MREKEELLLDLIEVRAYRELQSEPFDFGTGLIENDSKFSEDAYYKMEENEILEKLRDLEEGKTKKNKQVNNKKIKNKRKYYLDKKAEKRMKKLHEIGVYQVYEAINEDTGEKYMDKFYLSGRKGFAKRQSNKKVRKSNNFPLKGGGYRKVYDYWWEVF